MSDLSLWDRWNFFVSWYDPRRIPLLVYRLRTPSENPRVPVDVVGSCPGRFSVFIRPRESVCRCPLLRTVVRSTHTFVKRGLRSEIYSCVGSVVELTPEHSRFVLWVDSKRTRGLGSFTTLLFNYDKSRRFRHQ